jgi:hypothetical protein
MVNYSLSSTTNRWMSLFRRFLEITAVLTFAVVGTVINLCFGWVAPLLRTSPDASRQSRSIPFPVAVKSSKQF